LVPTARARRCGLPVVEQLGVPASRAPDVSIEAVKLFEADSPVLGSTVQNARARDVGTS